MNVLPLKQGIIYGPVDSRRLERSLGVNLSPVTYKLCTFNCIYCHFGWTECLTRDVSEHIKDFPTKEDIFLAVRSALESIANLDYITFSGDGEPTLHPEFESIVEGIKKIRNELTPETPLAILSNSSMLKNESVKSALAQIDVKILKLDAGIEEIFQKLNKPAAGISLQNIIEALKKEKNFVTQTLFVKGNVDNTDEKNLAKWIKAIASISPKSVQIYSTDRPVPDAGIIKVGAKELKEIAHRTENETNVPVEVFSIERPIQADS